MSTQSVIHCGDALTVLRSLPAASAQTCVTSPPYFGLRDYGMAGQIGLEPSPDAYVARLVEVFREVARVLRDDGTLWLNLGDSYAGSWGAQSQPGGALSETQIAAAPKRTRTCSLVGRSDCKAKDLIGIPWLVAFALRADGWYLRSEIIWHKPNPMPESVTDRPTKAHEQIFLLAKSERYYYDADAIAEPHASDWMATRHPYQVKSNSDRGDGGQPPQSAKEKRNRRSVWTVATHPYSEAHFATFPPALITPCVLAGAPPGGVVLDPFAGASTTGVVALTHGRSFVGIELNPAYVAMGEKRIAEATAQRSVFDLAGWEHALPVAALADEPEER